VLTGIRLVLGSVPVGGVGPRPKREVLLIASIAMPRLGEGSGTKGAALALGAKRVTVASKAAKAAKKKKKPASTTPDKPKTTPTGGVGRKRRSSKP
jgi:hypothetical protein